MKTKTALIVLCVVSLTLNYLTDRKLAATQASEEKIMARYCEAHDALVRVTDALVVEAAQFTNQIEKTKP